MESVIRYLAIVAMCALMAGGAFGAAGVFTVIMLSPAIGFMLSLLERAYTPQETTPQKTAPVRSDKEALAHTGQKLFDEFMNSGAKK